MRDRIKGHRGLILVHCKSYHQDYRVVVADHVFDSHADRMEDNHLGLSAVD